MKDLTKAEELLLLTIWRLKDNTYGVAMKKKIAETTGKNFAYGTLYALLDQLTLKGHVTRIKGEPTPERGGRSKTYYKLTQRGIEALKVSIQMQKLIWKDVTELSFEYRGS